MIISFPVTILRSSASVSVSAASDITITLPYVAARTCSSIVINSAFRITYYHAAQSGFGSHKAGMVEVASTPNWLLLDAEL